MDITDSVENATHVSKNQGTLRIGLNNSQLRASFFDYSVDTK
jgi:hypothetical protein